MRRRSLVWIDANEAVIVRWQDAQARVDRVESEVPAHHRSTGHVRHDPMIRHGGGRAQDADARHRQEHLDRFVEAVGARLAPDEDVLILGPGTVRQHLVRRLRHEDRRRGTDRVVDSEPSASRTDPQLVARLRHHVGDEPSRRPIGRPHPAGS